MLSVEPQRAAPHKSRRADGTCRSTSPETRRQIARFLVVGTASVAVDLAVYALLTALTPLNWGLAKGVSYAAGVVVGFFGNKFWTFESARRSAAEPTLYLLLYAGTLVLNIGCNQMALWLLGAPLKFVAFVFATGVTMVTNFLGMKLVAFRGGIAERKQMRNAECGVRSDGKCPVPRTPHSALRIDLTPDS